MQMKTAINKTYIKTQNLKEQTNMKNKKLTTK